MATSLQSPLNFYKKLPIKSAKDIFLSDSLSLQRISIILNDEHDLAIQALTNIMIDDVAKFINVGKTMNGSQLKETVGIVVRKYKYYKPEDFKSCFERIKEGYYGQMYDRFDGQIILQCLEKYDVGRCTEIEGLHAKINSDLKSNPVPGLLQQLTEAASGKTDNTFKYNITKLREYLDNQKKERESAKINIAKTELVHNPIVDMHQDWIKQFDKLWYKQKNRTARMVYKYGKVKSLFKKDYGKIVNRMLDINSYLEHKQWQYVLANLPYDDRMAEYLIKYPA